MDEKLIRERIRLKLALGSLQHHDGLVVRAPSGAAPPCQACGRQIDAGSTQAQGHSYAVGTHWFHAACHALWQEERIPTASTADTARGTSRLGRGGLTP